MTALAEEATSDDQSGGQADSPRPARRPSHLFADPNPPADPLGRGFWSIFGELVAAVAVTVVVSLIVQFVLSRPHVPQPSYAPQAISTIVVTVLTLGAFWLAARSRFALLARVVSWAGLSTLVSSVLTLMLLGTRFYLAGIAGDQLFRIEYITRFTDSAAPGDFAYPNMPGYYPRGWFWLAGRLAALAHVQGWEIYKPFAIATMAVGVVLAYVLWCLVARPAHALLVSVAIAGVAVTTYAANEPYAWIFGASLAPLAVLAWKYLTARDTPEAGRGRFVAPLLLGLTLGLYALFYTLLFGFFVMLLVVAGAIGVLLARRSSRAPLWTLIRPVLLRLVGVGLIALPLTLVQWVPYLATALGATDTESGAQRWLPWYGTEFPLDSYPVSFAGILSLIGLVWGLLRLRNSTMARGLILLIGGAYLWYLLSFVAILAHTTLLPFKIELVLDEGMACAGVLGLIDGVRWLWRRVGAQWRTYAVTTISALALLGMVGELEGAASSLSDLVTDAYSNYYPSGVNALGQHDTTQSGAWNADLHSTISTLTGKPDDQLVVLSTYQDFLAYYPYWNFQTTVLEYANPLADFDQRRAAIQSWADVTSPQALTAALASSRFRAPDVFVFTRKSDGLHLTVSQNVFPAAADDHSYDIVFAPSLFNSPAFTTRQVGPFTVVVRN